MKQSPFEKLKVPWLAEIASAFDGTQKVCYSVYNRLKLILSAAWLIQAVSSHPLFLKLILILFSHLCEGLSSRLLSAFFSYLNSGCILFFCACHMSYSSHHPSFDLPNYIWGEVQIMKLLNVQFSLVSCDFLLLRPWYLVHPLFCYS